MGTVAGCCSEGPQCDTCRIGLSPTDCPDELDPQDRQCLVLLRFQSRGDPLQDEPRAGSCRGIQLVKCSCACLSLDMSSISSTCTAWAIAFAWTYSFWLSRPFT